MSRPQHSVRLGHDVFELEDRRVLSTTSLMTTPAMVAVPKAAMTTVSPRMIESVITIANPTQNTLSYYLQFGSSQWQLFRLTPGQVMAHRAPGANRLATICFDGLAKAGYQEVRATLTSKNFVCGGPETWNRTIGDGQQHRFQVNPARTGWQLVRLSGIDVTRNAHLRAAAARDFENLGTNFEILGAATGNPNVRGSYNCISWTLGKVNEWTWPQNFSDIRAWDALYGAQGYRRMSTLDLSLRPGYQKVVLYWGTVPMGANGQGPFVPGFTHAALQESDGMWSSKTGGNFLIKHASPYQVAGKLYGKPAVVYIRPIA